MKRLEMNKERIPKWGEMDGGEADRASASGHSI
jgi:hypothetical protein